jgi:archaellum component FlaC
MLAEARAVCTARLMLSKRSASRDLEMRARHFVKIPDDMRDIKVRMTNAEEALAGVNRRLDRLDARLERIEKRLDLVQA